jgi:hypothetical protein
MRGGVDDEAREAGGNPSTKRSTNTYHRQRALTSAAIA